MLRRNSLKFEVVRDVLRAMMACNFDFHQNRWGPNSTEIAAISNVLDSTIEDTVRGIYAMRIPTVQGLQEDWFNDPIGNGDLAQSILKTARFLAKINGGAAIADYSTALNQSYFDAAISYPQKVDINKIIRINAGAMGLLQYSWADSGCSAQQGLAAIGELLGGASRVDAVIGPGCSSACEMTSYLSGGQGIPQISWGCTASSLSNKENHRLVRPCYPPYHCALIAYCHGHVFIRSFSVC